MKICYIADAVSPHSVRWINYFAGQGHSIYLISASRPEIPLPPGVFLHLLKDSKFKSLKIIANALAVRRLVKKIKPDVLHAHYAGVNGVLAWLAGFRPLVITAWGSDILVAAQKPVLRFLISSALKRADLITCDALHLKEEIVKLGLPEKKIKIINFGVETGIFKPGKPDAELQKNFGLEGKPSVISVRSLALVYDIPTLLRAAVRVAKEMPNVKFVIGGRGPLETELKGQAKSMGLDNNVAFAGFIPHDDLPRWFTAFDCYVSTSLSDAGIAGSTAEAMACGLPAVISATGENEKWIDNGHNGFLFPAGDDAALARQLVALLKSRQKQREIGAAARDTIIERNDYHNEMGKMEKLYYSLSSRPERKRI